MRLRDPKRGTVIHAEGDQAARYLASGWVDADKPPEPKPDPVVKSESEGTTLPKRRGRPPTTKK